VAAARFRKWIKQEFSQSRAEQAISPEHRDETMADLSESSVEIIPHDPEFIPPENAQVRALEALRTFVADGDECAKWGEDYVQVIGLLRSEDQAIVCPHCQEKTFLDKGDVFCLGEELFSAPPTDIPFIMPCCGAELPMSSVGFDPIVGFAQFGLRISNTNRTLSFEQIKKLGEILGCALTQIQLSDGVSVGPEPDA